jgi:DinB superfamily
MADLDLMAQLKSEISVANSLLLATIEGLSEEQIQARPGGTLASIAFQIWHTARWADHDGEAHYGGGKQIWYSQGFSQRWNLAGLDQSDSATGTGLGDDQAAALALPGKQELITYASAAFAAMERLVEDLNASQLATQTGSLESTGGSIQTLLFTHLSHVNRHLGMIEAIKGLLGQRGTATR